MTITYLESDELRVGVDPGYGARVVSLIDRRSGREWMTAGSNSPNTGEQAQYSGAEAVAWDECFPTVGVWDARQTPWRRPLRDHGDLWGRPWQVVSSDAVSLKTTYTGDEYVFTRELRIKGPRLVASYAVANKTTEPLPYLWALHSLFAVTPGDWIEVPDQQPIHASFMSQKGHQLPGGVIEWEKPNDRLSFRLDEVQPPSSQFMGKFLIGGIPGGEARLGRSGQWLEIAWDDRVDSLGIWITYGAWPEPGGHQEVALEPTSARANDLGEAIAAGAMPLAPGETREWQVTLTVTP